MKYLFIFFIILVIGYLFLRNIGRFLRNIFFVQPDRNPGRKKPPSAKEKIEINKDDIIEADFEELDSEKSKEKNH